MKLMTDKKLKMMLQEERAKVEEEQSKMNRIDAEFREIRDAINNNRAWIQDDMNRIAERIRKLEDAVYGHDFDKNPRVTNM